MKTKHILLLLIIALAAGFTSCSKDDDKDEEVKENEIIYKDTNTKLAGAFCQNLLNTEDSRIYEVILYSNGVTLSHTTNEYAVKLSGIGHLLTLTLYSDNTNFEGEYIFYKDPMNIGSNTKTVVMSGKIFSQCTFGSFSEHSNSDSKIIGTFMNSDTTVSIKKVDSDYEITIKGMDDEDNSVSIYYKGTVTFNTVYPL